jgi:hypothetical protein
MSITDEGFVFSIDLFIPTVAVLLMLFVATASFVARSDRSVSALKNLRLQKNALFLADALVKNNAKNPLLGSAVADMEKHRVKSNELYRERLLEAKPVNSSEFVIQGLSVRKQSGEKEMILSAASHEQNCIAIDRVVLLDEKTSVVELIVCER